jgi:hypothetical protein
MKILQYVRKQFPVEAVLVTEENFEEVENSFVEASALNAPDGPPSQDEVFNVFEDNLADVTVPKGTKLTRADFEAVNPATSK